MASFDTLRTPDYSPLLVHFTKDRPLAMANLLTEDHPLFAHKQTSAKEKLTNILVCRQVYGSPMPLLPHNPTGVSFTECIWRALMPHTDRYSRYGIVFSKRLIFQRGGGPALYVRGDCLKALGNTIPPNLERLMSPFDPEGILLAGVPFDYLHEREWRLPGDLQFEYADVECVIVDSLKDALDIIQHIGEQNLPLRKVIPMETWETTLKAWGDI